MHDKKKQSYILAPLHLFPVFLKQESHIFILHCALEITYLALHEDDSSKSFSVHEIEIYTPAVAEKKAGRRLGSMGLPSIIYQPWAVHIQISQNEKQTSIMLQQPLRGDCYSQPRLIFSKLKKMSFKRSRSHWYEFCITDTFLQLRYKKKSSLEEKWSQRWLSRVIMT